MDKKTPKKTTSILYIQSERNGVPTNHSYCATLDAAFEILKKVKATEQGPHKIVEEVKNYY